MYTAIMVPYRAAFDTSESNTSWFVYDCWMDACFLIDIVLTFFTVIFTAEGELVTDKKAIACDYLKFWFWIDLFTSLPF